MTESIFIAFDSTHIKKKIDVCFDDFDQNATECLAALISGGRQDMLSWGDSGFLMRSLLDVASR